jgi:hypothetical protein
MSKLVDRIEQLKTLDAGRKAADEAAYAAIVAAEARGKAWDVDKAASVLQRLGLDVAKLEADAAILKRWDAYRAEVATAKAARDAAAEEQVVLAAEEKTVQARLNEIAGRRQELRATSSNWVGVKAAADRFFSQHEKTLMSVDANYERGGL